MFSSLFSLSTAEVNKRVYNAKSQSAGTEQQLRKRTPEEVRLQTASENRRT